MGVKFGEIDSSQILLNEYRIGILERLLEFVLNNNFSIVKPTQDDLKNIKRSVVDKLKEKYPESGIKLKE